jgi:hypothetical protein
MAEKAVTVSVVGMRQFQQAVEELVEIRAVVARVMELHMSEHYERFRMTYCVECSEVEMGVFVGWPCNTVRALDGNADA